MRICMKNAGRLVGMVMVVTLALGSAVTAQEADKKSPGKKTPTKAICLTFNELPAARGFVDADKEAVNYLILQALRKHEVKATGFVLGENIENSFDVLGQWLNEGHVLGNMTYSNQDLHDLGIEQFIHDIKLGAEALYPMLSGFGQKARYFRYPFLHYGTTVEAKAEIELYLDHQKYKVAHATVVPEDYIYNLTLEKLGKIPDSAEYEILMNEYINHVLDEIERAEENAKLIMGRPVRQILLLRANRLNAVFLDEILTQIKKMDYEFISLDRALKDKLYQHSEAYFGPRGVGWLDMIKFSNPDLLPAE